VRVLCVCSVIMCCVYVFMYVFGLCMFSTLCVSV